MSHSASGSDTVVLDPVSQDSRERAAVWLTEEWTEEDICVE